MPRPGWNPPKKTPRCWSILVIEKLEHGGGLVPLKVGEDQTPVQDYGYISVCILYHFITCIAIIILILHLF